MLRKIRRQVSGLGSEMIATAIGYCRVNLTFLCMYFHKRESCKPCLDKINIMNIMIVVDMK